MTLYKMAFYGKAKRFVKKTAKRVVKKLGKRYVKKGGLRLGQVARDVMSLKKMMNVEKKSFENAWDTNFAQKSGAAGTVSGHNMFEITPSPLQGITATTRNGNSIKITGCMLNFQIIPQDNMTILTRYKVYLIHQKQSIYNFAPPINSFLDRTIFTGSVGSPIYDLTSLRNQEQVGNLKIIKVFSGSIKADVESGSTYKTTIQQPLKLNHHLRFDGDASQSSTVNRFFAVCVADTGNIDSTISTGIRIVGEVKWWFVDN